MNQGEIVEYLQSFGEGSAIPGIARNDVLELHIPLFPLETQQAIVAEIEAEQKLVDANKEWIAPFEKKIQAKQSEASPPR